MWVCFSVVTGYLYTLCSGKRMHHSTPYKVRLVYLHCMRPTAVSCCSLSTHVRKVKHLSKQIPEGEGHL